MTWNSLASATLMALLSSTAFGNLVTNGDFETGDLTGWSLDHGTINVTSPGLSGNFKLTMDNQGESALWSAPLATVAGQMVRFSMDVDSPGPAKYFMSPVSLSEGLFHDYHWNFWDAPGPAVFGSQHFEFDYIAHPDDVLYISYNGEHPANIDNVTVESVPEPITLVGLGLVALTARRRKTA